MTASKLTYVHNDPEFEALLSIVAQKKGIDITLVEKDYWIMHVLYGLQQLGITFELKGGTSLSKGFGIIDRFSEDIDICIHSHFGFLVTGNAEKTKTQQARKAFYDHLSQIISIDGIKSIVRDPAFDDVNKYRSGGIRLHYKSNQRTTEGLKSGMLLEVGFDQTTPNSPTNITSWVWDYLVEMQMHVDFKNNTAQNVRCYAPQFTLIEKLQTIVRKYRNASTSEVNFMRQYYDVYCLLGQPDIVSFLGTTAYLQHKAARIKGLDATIPLSQHPAFLLSEKAIRQKFMQQYEATASLYYREQPAFDALLARIQAHMPSF